MHSARTLTRVEQETSVCDHSECPAAAEVRVVLPEAKDEPAGTFRDLVFCMHHHRYAGLQLPVGSYVETLSYH
jgi:hypothetical protein